MNRFDHFVKMYMDNKFIRFSLLQHQEQLDFNTVFILADTENNLIYMEKLTDILIENILQKKMIRRQ
jgi:hypothetical protein